ncbi:MAG: GNAT family N-acetyltransferase [Oscillospiraceae bacterium]|nr:GNAT family N-acetyltransferase [Oscillospiraceae bacterium]
MKISEIKKDKKQYLELLLLADEQENMIDKYLNRGRMFIIDDNGVKGECVVTDEGSGILEIKNIAVDPEYQGEGYGRKMIEFLMNKYKRSFRILQVGTGESPLTVPFYEKCGFIKSFKVENFFTDNYDHPMYECGVQLKDMIYLRMKLR